MTKSSVDRKRSEYGEKYVLRFHKRLKTYELTCIDEIPHLIAKFVEIDGDLAMKLWVRLESNYKENEQLKKENIKLEEELQYCKVKSASCEQGLIQYERELNAYKMKVEEILRKWYANANKLRTPIRKLDYGEDISYWNGITQFIEELSDKLGVDMMTERDCGHCKHFQIDGMFGMWCDINDTDYLCEGECLNFERS